MCMRNAMRSYRWWLGSTVCKHEPFQNRQFNLIKQSEFSVPILLTSNEQKRQIKYVTLDLFG